MKRISSYYYRNSLIAIAGFFGIIETIVVVDIFTNHTTTPFTAFIPILFGLFFYSILNGFCRKLVDAVWDDGVSLIVKQKSVDERILISNIWKVRYDRRGSLHVVEIHLYEKCRFGQIIHFSVPSGLGFLNNPIAAELEKRSIEARKL